MIKTLRSGLWTCSRCIRQASRAQHQQRRWRSAAPSAAQLDGFRTPVDHSPPGAKYDDAVLRQIFDSPPTFRHFVRPLFDSASSRNVGLFRNKYLTSPQGFATFADVTVVRASRLVEKVLGASTVEEYKELVRDLDRLSDVLCRVLDVCDFVRVTHPDEKIQRAASDAWSEVYMYMNQLNTSTGLSDQLGRALASSEVMASWNEEERTVAQLLYQDFKKSAIHLPQETRDAFVDVSQSISELGANFVENMEPEQMYVSLPSSKFHGMPPQIAQRFVRLRNLLLPTMAPAATVALRSVHDADTREAIYMATRTASRRSVGTLEELLRTRAELANLSGFESYGQMALRDKMMAKTPESVHQFLSALSKHNTPLVEQEMTDLLNEKRKRLHLPTAADLHPWDKDYYMESIRAAMRSKRRTDDSLSAYFSLGTVMQGLSRLFTRLYGIRFVPTDTLPGETWHPDVRRLNVISDTDGHVAVLYCDLFYREDKSPNPAHFTVRCSREISTREIQEAWEQNGVDGLPTFESAIDAANDGMHVSQQSGSVKQLPTIALVCDFHQDREGQDEPALLDYYQVETLFHEMGHAIHSILARTSLQNVAGTRCATDLAELPSTLMEHFCADPSVLALFARHHKTDEPLPYHMIAERLQVFNRFEASDRENQIILAMLDQKYHSSLVKEPNFDSTEVYLDLQRKYGKLPPDPKGTRWQGFFGHLFGYGSTYYSYLFDQVLSERVWRVVFSAGQNGAALDRANGERLKENLLKWGGSRDPWRCLSDTLQDERLIDGDEKAMRLVGSWGIKDDVHG
ncbi:Uu.00g039010.m01.CDS01 [Anthostomella pinea]|uniref:Mitochondrial intermediate peptidase n=1 Tax=Anthostomella pinea TaxID=933095 RepID=A0AAI8YDX9_9PEZI|nr:Uu.00g039010.m01.CDS01 [Anthostomella pinea]